MSEQLTVTRDIVNEANELARTMAPEMMPSILVNACIGKKPQVAGVPDEMVTDRAPSEMGSSVKGLILSEENIISIERYNKFGLALPVTDDDVKATMKYDNDFDAVKYAEVAPAAFARLNRIIKNHCGGWTNLRKEIIMLGVSLNIFSKKFVGTGTEVLEAIRAMSVVQRALTNVGDYNATFAWNSQDKAVHLGAVDLIKALKDEVKIRHSSTQILVSRLETFRATMENEIVPGVSRMNTVLMDMKQSDERARLLGRIESLRKEIESLDKQYSQMVGYAFTGATGLLFLPVGILAWAITGGIFGDKAEQVRKKRNERQAEKETLTRQLAAEEHLTTFVTRTHDKVMKQSLILDEALVGVKNLEIMWGAVEKYIENSEIELAAITEAQKLILFTRRLDAAVASWGDVRDITGELNDLFNRAEEKARKQGFLSKDETVQVQKAMEDSTVDAQEPNAKPEGGVDNGDS